MIKKVISYTFFSGITAGINFLVVIYMTNIISPDDFGVVGLIMAILFFMPQVVSFAAVGLVSINKIKMCKAHYIEFLKSYFTFSTMNFVLVFALSLTVGLMLKVYYIAFIIVPIIAFIQYLSNVHSEELIQDGRSTLYGVYRLILSLVSLLVTVLCLSYFQLTWDGRLYAILFSEFLIILVQLKFSYFTLKNFQFTFDILKFKEYYYFGLPLLVGLGAGWILNQADRFIVLKFFTLKDVGIYSVALSIGAIVNLINQAATNAATPTIYKYLQDKKGHIIIKKLNIYYSLTIMIFSVIIGMSSYWYVPLLFDIKYQGSSTIILFISLAGGFSGIYRTTGSVLVFYKENTLQMKLLYFCAITNILFSIIVIPIFGIASPAISTMASFMLLAYLTYKKGWEILQREEKC